MESELGWKEAIITVLRAANAPMHYAEIAEQVFERGLRTNQTATPAATVAATVSESLKYDEHSPFVKVSRGVFALSGVATETSVIAPEDPSAVESSEATGLVNAFGMFWNRVKVHWVTEPRILGQQQTGSTPVNFCEQRGVYLLHDDQGVVYVGRATDQGLGRRLQQHTSID
jgi:hypothetical protein